MVFRLRVAPFGIRRKEKCVLYLIIMVLLMICMGAYFYLPQESHEDDNIVKKAIHKIFRHQIPGPIKAPNRSTKTGKIICISAQKQIFPWCIISIYVKHQRHTYILNNNTI